MNNLPVIIRFTGRQDTAASITLEDEDTIELEVDGVPRIGIRYQDGALVVGTFDAEGTWTWIGAVG